MAALALAPLATTGGEYFGASKARAANQDVGRWSSRGMDRIEARTQHDHRAWSHSIRAGGDRRRPIPFDDVVWGVEEGVDPTVPGKSAVLGDLWQLELEQLPVGVEDRVNGHALRRQPRGERDTVRGVAPVRLIEPHAVP